MSCRLQRVLDPRGRRCSCPATPVFPRCGEARSAVFALQHHDQHGASTPQDQSTLARHFSHCLQMLPHRPRSMRMRTTCRSCRRSSNARSSTCIAAKHSPIFGSGSSTPSSISGMSSRRRTVGVFSVARLSTRTRAWRAGTTSWSALLSTTCVKAQGSRMQCRTLLCTSIFGKEDASRGQSARHCANCRLRQ